jgi:hypothetical protein
MDFEEGLKKEPSELVARGLLGREREKRNVERNSNVNKQSVDVRVESINPELAKSYLAKMGKNRHVTQHHLMSLVRDMKAGRWVFNGDPIRFNGEKLIDGQHRLNALIQSGKTLEFVVIRQLPKDAFDTIDIGRRRSTADYLGMAGHHYPQRLSSAARWYLAYKRYQNFGSHEPITNNEKLEIVKEVPQLATYVQGYTAGGRPPLPMSAAMLATCHLLFWERAKAPADEFMDGVVTGLELKSGDPRATARNWVIRRPRVRHGSYNPFTVEAGNLLIRAWNAWRGGEQLVKINPMKEPPIIK